MEAPRALPSPEADLAALGSAMVRATDEQLAQALELIDSLAERGSADDLVETVRPRLRRSRPPRRLRFPRLLLHPIDILLVPPSHWRNGDATLPRNGLVCMALHVRQQLGPRLRDLNAAIAGATTDDTSLIERLGRDLWPEAADILRRTIDAIPGLGQEVGYRHQRPLTLTAIGLLTEAPAFTSLIAATANGLLPPHPDALGVIIDRVATDHEGALPSLITLLMARMPQLDLTLDTMEPGPHATQVRAARDRAGATLLRRLDELGGLEASIDFGTLSDAGRTARTLVQVLDPLASVRLWRDRVQKLRARLDAACQARFLEGITTELLDVLEAGTDRLDAATVQALEASARGLRLLEEAGRAVGGGQAGDLRSGPAGPLRLPPGPSLRTPSGQSLGRVRAHAGGSGSIYDALLKQSLEAITAPAGAERLSLPDRVRLVEILSGTEAALILLNAV